MFDRAGHESISMSETDKKGRLVWTAFLRSCEKFPDRPAVEVAGCELSYKQLGQRARRLAATIQANATPGEVPLAAVFAYRSQTAYAGVLGALMAGHGYVPLNPTFPIDRTKLMLERSMGRSLIVDARSEPQLQKLLSGFALPLVICPDQNDVTELAKQLPSHQVIGAAELADAAEWKPRNIDVNSIAYLLFTSGSTGQPKGVMVSHANVLHYVDYVTERYGIENSDRERGDEIGASEDDGAGESGRTDCHRGSSAGIGCVGQRIRQGSSTDCAGISQANANRKRHIGPDATTRHSRTTNT